MAYTEILVVTFHPSFVNIQVSYKHGEHRAGYSSLSITYKSARTLRSYLNNNELIRAGERNEEEFTKELGILKHKGGNKDG